MLGDDSRICLCMLDGVVKARRRRGQRSAEVLMEPVSPSLTKKKKKRHH